MPTSLTSFANSEFRMRYREQYVTEGLNMKLAVNTPPGTYRGFRLATHGSNDTVTIEADANSLDHVAVYQTLDGFSLTVRKTGGDYALDLSTLVDASQKTWVLCIYADYTIGATTTAEHRAYELLPSDEFTPAVEKGELIVLGTVTIPAGGGVPIPTANIVPDRRTFAWESKADEAVSWSALLKNGGFDFSFDENGEVFSHASAWWWRGPTTTGDGYWQTNTSDVHSGTKALGWYHASAASTANCVQDLNVPVEPGRLFRYRFYKKALKVSTGGTCRFALEWLDSDGDPLSATNIDIDLSATDASHVEVAGTIAAPTGAYYLSRVFLINTTLNFGSSGLAFVLDDVQLWMESKNQERDQLASAVGQLWATALSLRDPTDATDFADVRGAVYRYDKTQGQSEWGGIVLTQPGIETALPDPSAPALIGQVTNDSGYTYTLLREHFPSGQVGVREYISRTGQYARVINAAWSISGNQWVKDDGGADAIRFLHDAAKVRIEYHSGAGPFGDGAWTGELLDTNPFDAKVSASGVLTSTTVTGQIGQLRDGKHGTKTIWLNAMAAYGGPNDMAGYGLVSAPSGGMAAWQSNTTGGTKYLTWPLPLHTGDRITYVGIFGVAGNAAGEELQGKIFRSTMLAGSTQISTTKTSAASGTWVTIEWTTSDTDFTPNGHTMIDQGYTLWTRLPQTSAGGEVLITGAKIQYDHP